VYTTSAPPLQSNNGNGAWGTILSEVLALKALDGSARYYYGVVATSYSSGVAGLGYVGGSARTAIGWDRLPSGSGVMAHELGHNMGRSHAPCGGVSSPDPAYPYAGGGIGIWGLDVATLTLKSPATYKDLMGYCSPDWVSDYNWTGMVNYRGGGPNNVVAAGVLARGLLVWGRITPTGVVLEPAFVVDAPASLPPSGPYRVQGFGVDGSLLFEVPFRAHEVYDLPGGTEEAFAFVLPLDRGLELELQSLRLRAGGRTAAQTSLSVGAPGASVTREAGGDRLRWNASAHPVVLVRDRATGRVLSFARSGDVLLPRGEQYRLTWSDGVRSLTTEEIPR